MANALADEKEGKMARPTAGWSGGEWAGKMEQRLAASRVASTAVWRVAQTAFETAERWAAVRAGDLAEKTGEPEAGGLADCLD